MGVYIPPPKSSRGVNPLIPPLVFALVFRVMITYHFGPGKSAFNEIFWSQLISKVSPQNLVTDNEVIYGF